MKRFKKPPSLIRERKIKADRDYFTWKERRDAKISGIATLIVILSFLFIFAYSFYMSM
jgi:hypothetical protein